MFMFMLIIKKSFYTISSFLLLAPFFVVASNDPKDYGLKDNPGAGGSATDFAVVIGKIVTWLLGFVGALAVLMIIVAGIMYLTSGGDEGRVEKAKQWLIYAIVGLIVALLGWVIVNSVISIL